MTSETNKTVVNQLNYSEAKLYNTWYNLTQKLNQADFVCVLELKICETNIVWCRVRPNDTVVNHFNRSEVKLRNVEFQWVRLNKTSNVGLAKLYTSLLLIYYTVNVIKFVLAHRRHKKRIRFCGWHFHWKKILNATSDTIDGVSQTLLH